jgi:hypothetical protein
MLECECQNCHRRIRFKRSEAGHIAACPFCLKQTLLQVESVPRQRAKLPQWVLPVAALLAITVILTVALYKFEQFIVQEYTGFGGVNPLPFPFFFIAFLWVASLVLTISFAIYVFNWLRETRVLLREIAANTRAPKTLPPPPEHGTPSAWPPPPKPLIPPAEAKYMPKS